MCHVSMADHLDLTREIGIREGFGSERFGSAESNLHGFPTGDSRESLAEIRIRGQP